MPATNATCETAIPLRDLGCAGTIIIDNIDVSDPDQSTDILAYDFGESHGTLWYSFSNTLLVPAVLKISVGNPSESNRYPIAAIHKGPCPIVAPDETSTYLYPPGMGNITGSLLAPGTDNLNPAGLAIQPGETLYIEVGTGDSNKGIFSLSWALLNATFYDSIESTDNLNDGESSQFGSLLPLEFSYPDYNVATDPLPPTELRSSKVVDYVKVGDVHWILTFAGKITYPTNSSGVTTGFSYYPWKVHKVTSSGITSYPLVTPGRGLYKEVVPTTTPPSYVYIGREWGTFDDSVAGMLATDGVNVWAAFTDVIESSHFNFAQATSVYVFCSTGGAFNSIGSGYFDAGGASGVAAIYPLHNVSSVEYILPGYPMLCASAAEPGVCHLVWAEQGFFQSDFSSTSFMDQSNLIAYLHYCICDTTSVTPQSDIYFDSVPYDGISSSGIAWTVGNGILSNDGGVPLLFWSNLLESLFPNVEPVVRLFDLTSVVTNSPNQVQLLDGGTQLGPYTASEISSHNGLYAVSNDSNGYLYFTGAQWVSSFSLRTVHRLLSDGTGPFDYLDADISSVPMPIGETESITVEDRNVWVPVYDGSTSSFTDNQHTVRQWSRQCPNWYTPKLGDEGLQLRPLGFHTYVDGDILYWSGEIASSTPDASGLTRRNGVYASKILRNILVCSVGSEADCTGGILWFFKNGIWRLAGSDPDYNVYFYKDGNWHPVRQDSLYDIYAQLQNLWQSA